MIMLAAEGLYEPSVVLGYGQLCAWKLALVNEVTVERHLEALLMIEYHLGIQRQLTKLSLYSREVLLPLIPKSG